MCAIRFSRVGTFGFQMVSDDGDTGAQRASSFCHLSIEFAVAGVECICRSPFVLQGDQMRQFVVFGSGDFAGVFREARADVVQLQFRIDFLFGASGDSFSPFKLPGILECPRGAAVPYCSSNP
jgi:hypothetical protein